MEHRSRRVVRQEQPGHTDRAGASCNFRAVVTGKVLWAGGVIKLTVGRITAESQRVLTLEGLQWERRDHPGGQGKAGQQPGQEVTGTRGSEIRNPAGSKISPPGHCTTTTHSNRVASSVGPA